MPREVTRALVERATGVIQNHVRETPVVSVAGKDFGLEQVPKIVFKLEYLQHSGSFKSRGAFFNLLTRAVPEPGVVAASGGNHGAAVAFAARRLGIPAKIFVPSVVSRAKLEQLRSYGASIAIVGDRYADALEASLAWQVDTGAMPIHAFDQKETLAGQGTLGIEAARQAPEVSTWLIAVGGGGLIGGVAAWARGQFKLIGVEPELAPTLTHALQAGGPVDAPAGGIAADSLAPRRVGSLAFPIIRRFVDRALVVSEHEIQLAQAELWRILRVVTEPGGAAAFAALLSGRYAPAAGETVGVVLCGANTVLSDFEKGEKP